MLPAVLGVTIPDNPASAGTLSTGGAGVSEVVFLTPAMGLFPFALLYVRIDGKQIVPMQGMAVPFLIPGAYHINRHIRIGPLFHKIFPIFPSILNFVTTVLWCNYRYMISPPIHD